VFGAIYARAPRYRDLCTQSVRNSSDVVRARQERKEKMENETRCENESIALPYVYTRPQVTLPQCSIIFRGWLSLGERIRFLQNGADPLGIARERGNQACTHRRTFSDLAIFLLSLSLSLILACSICTGNTNISPMKTNTEKIFALFALDGRARSI